MDFSPDKLREHFMVLSAKREKIDKQLEPLRTELDALVAGKVDITLVKAQRREATIRARIKELQQELHPVEQERAAVSRALGGKTGGE